MRTTIHIPQPCPQSWANMTPDATGRHCAACQKTVVDFTLKTDAEVLTLLAQAASKGACGRFRAEQLNQPLHPAKPSNRWRSWLSAALTLGSLASVISPKAAAQSTTISYSGGPEPLVQAGRGATPTAPTLQTSPTTAAPTAPPPAPQRTSPLVLHGVVLDASTHESLPGVTVLIKHTRISTSTNQAGEFTLEVAPELLAGQLQISFVGYEGVEQSIAKLAASPSLPVLMKESVRMLMGEVVVIYSPKPYPWHPRAFFGWSKNWLTKPFRR